MKNLKNHTRSRVWFFCLSNLNAIPLKWVSLAEYPVEIGLVSARENSYPADSFPHTKPIQ